MYQTLPESGHRSETGQLDLSFRKVKDWGNFLGCKTLTLLMGDDDAGPMVFFSSSLPSEDKMKCGFAHGHDSDNWRISIQGTTNMGKYAYTQSQFRFQDGGIPYPGDNLTWGPEGGFGFVVFADRRGYPIRPVDEKFVEQMETQQKSSAALMNIDVHHPCPGAPAIRSTLGDTEHGHLDSSFESAATWPELTPGSRAVVSVMGERTVGPVLVLLHCEPGALVTPAGDLASETLHAVAGGSCLVDGETKTLGDFWVTEAGHQSEVVAGPNGMSHVVIVGNRQSLTGFEVNDHSQAWLDNLNAVTSDLVAAL